mgnify:CR=1 FL=1
MKLGFSNYLTRGDVLKEIKFAKDHGFQAYELGIHCTADFHYTDQELRNFKEASDGLTVTAHLPYYLQTATQLDEIHKANMKVLEKSMVISHKAGAENVVIHPGYMEHSDDLENLTKNLRDIMMVARRYDFKVCLENLPAIPNLNCSESDDLTSVLGSIPDLYATFDIGHANTSPQEPADYFARISEYVKHVHMHDNLGEQDEHLVPGRGTVQFSSLFRKMKEAGYEGPVILELPSYDDILAGKDFFENL